MFWVFPSNPSNNGFHRVKVHLPHLQDGGHKILNRPGIKRFEQFQLSQQECLVVGVAAPSA
jgi:hypothetical protein